MIKLKITKDIPSKLCDICNLFDFDINVIDGRIIVDGKSIVGVMELVGHTVSLVPMTDDTDGYDAFYSKVEEIGAEEV